MERTGDVRGEYWWQAKKVGNPAPESRDRVAEIIRHPMAWMICGLLTVVPGVALTVYFALTFLGE